jgi:hypothetical protein
MDFLRCRSPECDPENPHVSFPVQLWSFSPCQQQHLTAGTSNSARIGEGIRKEQVRSPGPISTPEILIAPAPQSAGLTGFRCT